MSPVPSYNWPATFEFDSSANGTAAECWARELLTVMRVRCISAKHELPAAAGATRKDAATRVSKDSQITKRINTKRSGRYQPNGDIHATESSHYSRYVVDCRISDSQCHSVRTSPPK